MIAAPDELADKNLPGTKDGAKWSDFRWCQLVIDTGPQIQGDVQCLFKKTIFQCKDTGRICFDKGWFVEHLNISISVVTGIQHTWSTRWSRFSSCKRRIREARISWIKNKCRTTFSATLKRKQLTAMEHSISPRKRRARCIPANASMCFLILHAWSMNVPSTESVQAKYSLSSSFQV